MDQDDRREEQRGEGDQPAHVATQLPLRDRQAAPEGERLFDDEQMQQHGDVAEDFLAGDGIVVVQVEHEQRREEEQPEQGEGMVRLPGARQHPEVAEGDGQDQDPGKHGDEFQPRHRRRDQVPELSRQPAPDESLGIVDQPVGVGPVVQAGAEGVFGEPVDEVANPGGGEDKQQERVDDEAGLGEEGFQARPGRQNRPSGRGAVGGSVGGWIGSGICHRLLRVCFYDLAGFHVNITHSELDCEGAVNSLSRFVAVRMRFGGGSKDSGKRFLDTDYTDASTSSARVARKRSGFTEKDSR